MAQREMEPMLESEARALVHAEEALAASTDEEYAPEPDAVQPNTLGVPIKRSTLFGLVGALALGVLALHSQTTAKLPVAGRGEFISEVLTPETPFDEFVIPENVTDFCAWYHRFMITTIDHNNLGGSGPDSGPEGITLSGFYQYPIVTEGVEPQADVPVEIHVNALTEYRLDLVTWRFNGIMGARDGSGNHYLRIRMPVNTSAKFAVTIKTPYTMSPMAAPQEILRLPRVSWTFFDFDGTDGCENLKLEPFTQATMSANSSIVWDAEAAEANNEATFLGSAGAEALPLTPEELTNSQRDRAAQVTLMQVGEFNITLTTGECGGAQGTRDFAFLGMPSVSCASGPEGQPPPPPVIHHSPVPPPFLPEEDHEIKRCMSCWFDQSLSWAPPCSDVDVWWAKRCEGLR